MTRGGAGRKDKHAALLCVLCLSAFKIIEYKATEAQGKNKRGEGVSFLSVKGEKGLNGRLSLICHPPGVKSEPEMSHRGWGNPYP